MASLAPLQGAYRFARGAGMESRRILDLERELVDTRNAAVVLLLHMVQRFLPSGGSAGALADELDAAADMALNPAEARIARLAAKCLRSDGHP